MNLRQASAILVSRARATLALRNTHNDKNAHVPKTCLTCGDEAQIQEKALNRLLFCTTECQRTLRGLDHWLCLGMLRGHDAIAEVYPDVELLDLPDDVLGLLFAYAYRFELRSLGEYEELREMRILSLRLKYVIERRVYPSIRFVCSKVMKTVGYPGIRVFSGLETLSYTLLHNEFPDVRQLTEERPFRALRVLTLCFIPMGGGDLGALKNLEKLRLISVKISDGQIAALTSLRSLQLAYCDELSSECLAPLKNLESLGLGQQQNFQDLNGCSQLRKLKIDLRVKITDDGIAGLTGLEALVLRYSKGPDRQLTDQCLLNKPRLKKLDLRHNTDILRIPEPLLELEYLDISYGRRFQTGTLANAPNLTHLDVSNQPDFRHSHVNVMKIVCGMEKLRTFVSLSTPIYHFWKLPSSIDTLVFDDATNISNIDSLERLTSVKHIAVDQEKMAGNFAFERFPLLETVIVSNPFNGIMKSLRLLRNLKTVYMFNDDCFNDAAQIAELPLVVCGGDLIRYSAIVDMKKRGVEIVDLTSYESGYDRKPPHYSLCSFVRA